MSRATRASASATLRAAFALILLLLTPLAPVAAQTPVPPTPVPGAVRTAQTLLKSMSVAQKVGQLFLIQFEGDDLSNTSDIADLIVNYKVGGVQISAGRGNFVNGPDGPRQILTLTTQLQALVALSGTPGTLPDIVPTPSPSTTGASNNQPYIPLFIGIEQEGDGWPNSEITQGLTPLPSEMALGATWRPELSEAAGKTLGAELTRLGVNLLFGPMLDLVDAPKPGNAGDPGTRVFGGDPYWVGRHAAAMTRGLKTGSNGRLAVVAARFPGLGASDRNPEDEAPTVQRSMDQLRQFELAPFFAVTAPEGEGAVTVDGLLMAHIRFRGLQGNPRAVTNPISLDQQAQKDFMAQKELATWRAAGGVTFSDALGARSVRRIFETPDAPFNVRLITQNAFRAGNDVLTLGAFGLTASWAEQRDNIKAAIRSFRERYLIDPAFASDVDAAVVRILALKLKLYGERFGPAATPSPDVAAAIQPNAELAASVAKESVTVLWPGLRDLPSALPAAPGPNDTVVFLTDDRQFRECARCQPYAAISPTALRDAALRLYGTRTTGQLNPSRVFAYGFSELADALARADGAPAASATTVAATPKPTTAVTGTVPGVLAAIDSANWIVVGMLDFDVKASRSAQAFRDFLALRGDALRDKKVVVFGFGAPYHLDSTEITKLTAYFALYQHGPAAQEAAIRALFGEYGQGASPVSVPAVNYLLSEQTQPDPKQIIPLVALGPTEPTTRTSGTPVPLSPRLNDTLRVRAGPIVDRNGRLIPDGTPIQFILAYPTEGVREPQERRVASRNGYAETTITFERKGKLQISARTDTARQSDIIEANISDAAGEVVISRPTPFPTVTSEPPPSVTPRPTETSPPPRPSATPVPTPVPQPSGLAAFGLTVLALCITSVGVLFVLRSRRPVPPESDLVRTLLIAWSAGWAAYALLGVLVRPALSSPGGTLLALLGAVAAALGAAWATLRSKTTRANPAESNRGVSR
ncbi:MAG: hypothetical protein K1X39_03665 [Thermoflexales bacterium]|nr:hypothetical protein [Thermoflexales bacterium]